MYLDPPYRPISKTSSFESYSKGGFGDEGQIRLSDFYKNLSDKFGNVKLMLSNSNPQNHDVDDTFFIKLYSHPHINIGSVMATRAINSKAAGRGKIGELLIRNYVTKYNF